MLKKAVFLFLIIFGAVSMSNSQTLPEGYKKVTELGGIEEFQYEPNGLTVLLMEDHSAPVLTFMVTYRVGSRNEVIGNTGSTHILEHLMFKGTETYNKRKGTAIFATLQNIGALMNASTWFDRTNYFENLPSDKLEVAVKIEADRMRNLLLLKEDLASEMTVVRNEFEQGENNPQEALDKEIWATAIQAHPYHHSTIGWRSDIENVPIEKLREFYNTFYWPDNATVTIIGDFNKTNALSLVKSYFGKISKAPNPIPVVYTTEPEQNGPRRVTVKRSGELGIVGIAHKVPEGLSQDTYPLTVLNYILGSGKSSRFYKLLIDKGMATDVSVFYFPFRDKSLFIPYVFMTPGTSHADVEKAVKDEYEKIKAEGVTKEEIERAVGQITAETAYKRDGSYSIASEINEAIAAGDWKFYVNFLDNIKKVTPEDVQQVVSKYFVEDQSTTGYFIPAKEGAASEISSAKKNAADKKVYYRNPLYFSDPTTGEDSQMAMYNALAEDKTSIAKNVVRKKIEGVDVVTLKTGTKDVVRIIGSLAAGDYFAPKENAMIADLTGSMLDKGTVKSNKFQIAERLEKMGASVNFSVGAANLTFSALCLKKDVPEVISILSEELRTPAFSEEEFQKLKVQMKGNLQQMLENTNVMAAEALSRVIFPKDHPNYSIPVTEAIEMVNKATLDQLKAFHKKYYGSKSMLIVAVGDLETEKFQNEVKNAFKGWSGGVSYPEFPKAKITASKTEVVEMKDKASVTLMFGNATTLRKTDKEWLALQVGNYIFGGNFSARLMMTVRDEEGLTYGIRSGLSGDTYFDGFWTISGAFAPALLEKGKSSTLRELNKLVKDGVTAEELQNKKATLIGSFKVQMATTQGLAYSLLNAIQSGYDVDYLDKYPQMVDALTLDQVNGAIRKYFDPERLITVMAGSIDKDGKPLVKK